MDLPTVGAGLALERPADIGGDPAAVEVAGLRHDPLAVNQTLIHCAGVERNMINKGCISPAGMRVIPRRTWSDLATADHIQVRRPPFPLTKRGAPSRSQRTLNERCAREVVRRWVARLQDAPTASRLADVHTAQDHENLLIAGPHGGRPRVIPH